MNWNFRYVSEDEVFPDVQTDGRGIPAEEWWRWDEPYKISYREYVHNQSEKDHAVYSINSAVGRTASLTTSADHPRHCEISR
jgi:toluene monooxygenase system protein A